jgi:hypothetical protein
MNSYESVKHDNHEPSPKTLDAIVGGTVALALTNTIKNHSLTAVRLEAFCLNT